jgi:tetratricopeptide (TPR) repeat protein
VAESAEKGDWKAAREQAAAHRLENRDPKLLELMALVEYGNGNIPGAQTLLNEAISETPGEPFLQFLRLALAGKERGAKSVPDAGIGDATWDSPADFYRFAWQLLSGAAAGSQAPHEWEDGSEKTVLTWVLGQRQLLAGDTSGAARLFAEAAGDAGPDTPERLLALADWSRIAGRPWLAGKPAKSQEAKRLARSRLARSLVSTMMGQGSPEAQLKTLEELAALDPEDSSVLMELAFRYAGLGDWKRAAERVAAYWRRPHRVCANSMAAALLRDELLACQGKKDEARRALEAMGRRTDWPWYPAIARDLLGSAQGGTATPREPAEAITLESARGLWAEANGDSAAAIRHYGLALDSYLSTWSEYRFAESRISRLRKAAADSGAGRSVSAR